MSILTFVASLYIFVGGIGFLLNITALVFLAHQPQRPVMPLTVYGLSDSISGALTGIGLFTDGCVYFGNFVYTNTCYRYFLIYTLLLFPIVTHSFSALGIAVERYRAIVTLQKPGNTQRLFSLVWTLVSWFMALAFVIVLWGHTRLYTVLMHEDTAFYWEKGTEPRINRGRLDDPWIYDSHTPIKDENRRDLRRTPHVQLPNLFHIVSNRVKINSDVVESVESYSTTSPVSIKEVHQHSTNAINLHLPRNQTYQYTEMTQRREHSNSISTTFYTTTQTESDTLNYNTNNQRFQAENGEISTRQQDRNRNKINLVTKSKKLHIEPDNNRASHPTFFTREVSKNNEQSLLLKQGSLEDINQSNLINKTDSTTDNVTRQPIMNLLADKKINKNATTVIFHNSTLVTITNLFTLKTSIKNNKNYNHQITNETITSNTNINSSSLTPITNPNSLVANATHNPSANNKKITTTRIKYSNTISSPNLLTNIKIKVTTASNFISNISILTTNINTTETINNDKNKTTNTNLNTTFNRNKNVATALNIIFSNSSTNKLTNLTSVTASSSVNIPNAAFTTNSNTTTNQDKDATSVSKQISNSINASIITKLNNLSKASTYNSNKNENLKGNLTDVNTISDSSGSASMTNIINLRSTTTKKNHVAEGSTLTTNFYVNATELLNIINRNNSLSKITESSTGSIRNNSRPNIILIANVTNLSRSTATNDQSNRKVHKTTNLNVNATISTVSNISENTNFSTVKDLTTNLTKTTINNTNTTTIANITTKLNHHSNTTTTRNIIFNTSTSSTIRNLTNMMDTVDTVDTANKSITTIANSIVTNGNMTVIANTYAKQPSNAASNSYAKQASSAASKDINQIIVTQQSESLNAGLVTKENLVKIYTSEQNSSRIFSISQSNARINKTASLEMNSTLGNSFLTTVCKAQVGFLPIFTTMMFICVYALPLLVTASLYTPVMYVMYKHKSPTAQENSSTMQRSHTKRATLRVMLILIAYILCWTPFMVERLLYAWSLVNQLPTVVPALLFLIGHTHNLLRGLQYVFDNTQIRNSVSAMTTSNCGCISTTVAPSTDADNGPTAFGNDNPHFTPSKTFIWPSPGQNNGQFGLKGSPEFKMELLRVLPTGSRLNTDTRELNH